MDRIIIGMALLLVGAMVTAGRVSSSSEGADQSSSNVIQGDTRTVDQPDGTSTWITYHEVGLSFLAPAGMQRSAATAPITAGNQDGVAASVVVLSAADGRPVVSIAKVPNPRQLALDDWVATIPGWPGTPKQTTVGGLTVLLFESDQAGGSNPTFYVQLDGSVVGFRAATDLGSTPPAITRAEFDILLQGVTYDH